jgi:hypothetical protein
VEGGVGARRADHELGAPAADVEHEERVAARRPPAGGAQEREPRLLVAGDRARVDVEALGQLAPELLAVPRVPHSARGDGDDALRAVGVDRLPEGLDDREDTLDGGGPQAAGGVDSLAEARDLGPALELLHPSAHDVRHEQPRGVRPQVDDGDALVRHGGILRG